MYVGSLLLYTSPPVFIIAATARAFVPIITLHPTSCIHFLEL
jgi:hypothetical protein